MKFPPFVQTELRSQIKEAPVRAVHVFRNCNRPSLSRQKNDARGAKRVAQSTWVLGDGAEGHGKPAL